MAQVIKTANHGEILFEKTFVAGGTHIGKLANNKGYCTLGGIPIRDKSELTTAITGKDLEDALQWWAHKDDVVPNVAKPKIVIQNDGSYSFEDGKPIQGLADLIDSIAKGPALEAAVLWWSDRQTGKGPNANTVNQTWNRREQQCAAIKASNGQRCMNPVVPGTDYCMVPAHAALGKKEAGLIDEGTDITEGKNEFKPTYTQENIAELSSANG